MTADVTPRLVAVSGPLEGSTISITKDRISLGRASTNDICLEDRSVSRNHCVLEKNADSYEIVDLGSHNRTYVNQIAVDRRLLEHGSELRIGCSIFLFMIDEDESLRPPVLLPATATPNEPTVVLRREDAIFLNTGAALSTGPQTDRNARSLASLLKVATAISKERELGSLARTLLEAITEAIQAESAAILLTTEAGIDPNLVFHRGASGAGKIPAKIPSTLVKRVLEEKVSILSNDVQSRTPEDFGKSIIALNVQAVLCVPLVFDDRVTGVIYASSSDTPCSFDEHHLQILTGIAGLAAGPLQTARKLQDLQNRNKALEARINGDNSIVGESGAVQTLQRLIMKSAPTSSTVLITGESGTGKELVARAIHRNSPRSEHPFIAINCAALTETLLESEMFGHEKGAFTGAVALKRGKLEEADHGTIFLDEIGEMAPTLQARLLRVLQEREFERVGGTKTIRVDIRVIAATNRDLAAMARSGTFRQDLYYRLNVVTIQTPPLRERRNDIDLLAQYFVQKHTHIAGRRITGISREALECLRRYDWPGNIRELQNVIERALVLGSTDVIERQDLPENIIEAFSAASAGGGSGDFHEMVTQAKRDIVLTALQQVSWNYVEAGRRLGIHPNNLHRLIRTLDIKRQQVS